MSGRLLPQTANLPDVVLAPGAETTTLRARFAAFVLRVTGWTAVGEVPRTGILVGAPHTSN